MSKEKAKLVELLKTALEPGLNRVTDSLEECDSTEPSLSSLTSFEVWVNGRRFIIRLWEVEE